MDIEASVRAGDLEAALSAVKDRVRKEPAKSAHRILLFQLSVVTGDWDRALTQLGVLHDLDASALPMVQTYREAIRCEALRREVFAGRRTPLFLGEPAPWMARVVHALAVDAEGRHEEARRTREAAFEEAETISGTVDGTAFSWIADADSRIGPFLEAVVAGKYYFIPFTQLKRVHFDAPEDLRDLAWTPAQLELANGGQTVALVPTRYPGSEASSDNAIRLARKTEWEEKAENSYWGHGQRTFATDAADYALLDVRLIELAHG